MENEHVINGLVRKRAELAGEIEAAQKRIRALETDLRTVDATIRLFDPTIVVQAIRPRMKRGRPTVGSVGAFTRTVLDVLREAGRPLTTREIASAAALKIGQDVSKAPTMQKLIGQVRNALVRTREGLTSEKANDVIRWRMAGSE